MAGILILWVLGHEIWRLRKALLREIGCRLIHVRGLFDA